MGGTPLPTYPDTYIRRRLTLDYQLRELDERALAAARCLSRRFEAIATPVTYRTLCLNERIVAPDAESRYPNLLRNVSIYTNHVIARSDLNPDGIRRVIDRIQRLRTVRYVLLGLRVLIANC